MGAVRATQSLDRRVGTPARLEQIVVAPRLIGGIQARMIAAAGAARIREDQDALGATHEGVGLDQVGAPRATFDVLPPPAILDDAARSPCHFGDSVGPKPRSEERRVGKECVRTFRFRWSPYP